MGDATHGSETVEDDRASDTGMPWAVNGSLAAMKVTRGPPLPRRVYSTYTSIHMGARWRPSFNAVPLALLLASSPSRHMPS